VLRSENVYSQAAIVIALGKIGDPVAIPALYAGT